MPHEIPLSRPDITDLEIELVTSVMRSGRLSIGPMLEQFEQMVAARSDRLYGVGVSSGTSGLHLALAGLGIGPGDEVITTPFSFIASSNCILYVGAKPVFVDICPRSLNMDPAKIEAAITPRTKAILAVEAFGNPARMNECAAIAARHEISLIEDCCEALGCSLNGQPAGSFGRVGVFGFYPNKQITTGEGGMIVTNDRRLADLCRSMRNQGRPLPTSAASASAPSSPGIGTWLCHERLGYNYRLTEIAAAIGVGQMRRLDEIIQKRQSVARLYFDRLMDNHDLILPTCEGAFTQSWFVFVARLASAYTREERDRIIQGMRRHEIGAGDYFPCIHLQPFYRDRFGYAPGDFPIAESVSQRTIALPFFGSLGAGDVDLVCQTLAHMISRENIKQR
ncbi:MAG: DegT/DnrJ/EryC1/StrS family aminotransferase [Phycisphaerales bacterium]|nr:DegT/DnrJ/EryC1/StrS family aminotransferase [Phycisphaerales bacterium]